MSEDESPCGADKRWAWSSSPSNCCPCSRWSKTSPCRWTCAGISARSRSRQRALDLLRLVEIEEHADKLPAFISGGQQQRVAIARALANDPPILIADEPTGSLDSVTADHIFEVFEHLVTDQGKTIVMVTHDESLAPRFSRTLQITDGELDQKLV
jgi:putative ABC transport system ATP-binding protein